MKDETFIVLVAGIALAVAIAAVTHCGHSRTQDVRPLVAAKCFVQQRIPSASFPILADYSATRFADGSYAVTGSMDTTNGRTGWFVRLDSQLQLVSIAVR
jgi:hypothetical protein